MATYTYTDTYDNTYELLYVNEAISDGIEIIDRGKTAMEEDANNISAKTKKIDYYPNIAMAVSPTYEKMLETAFDELLYRTKMLSIGQWDENRELSISSVKDIDSKYNLNKYKNKLGFRDDGISFARVKAIINFIKNEVDEYDRLKEKGYKSDDLNQKLSFIFAPNNNYKYYQNFMSDDDYSITEEEYNTFLKKKLYLFKLKHEDDSRIKDWDITIYKDFLEYGDNDINKFISEKTNGNSFSDGVGLQELTSQGTSSSLNDGGNQFNSSKTDEDTNAGKTDTGKSDDNSSPDKGKTEPTKDTDTKDSDKTFENKPKPDNPPIISDNKGSSGVSHGGLSSNNGNGNYTFTNSGISASQDEPIEILTDEKPGNDQITSLPDDNEDIYTIPTDLSGVTSTKKHSSGGGSSVIPILGGLGAAAAVGVGAKIYMDNKKNNDNDEDSSESDDNTEDWNETSNENDGILADEWNEDDSNFEFDDSEPNMDDDESGFSEI